MLITQEFLNRLTPVEVAFIRAASINFVRIRSKTKRQTMRTLTQKWNGVLTAVLSIL